MAPMTWPPRVPPPAKKMRAGRAPVVAAAVLVDLRRAAELGQEDDQRLVEQAAGVQVVDQGREGPVDAGQVIAAAWPSRRCAAGSAPAALWLSQRLP